MTAPFIACFDLATTTGCCDGPVGGRPRFWQWDLRDGGEARPARLLHLWNFLGSYLTEQRVDRLFYEAPVPLAAMMEIGSDEDTIQFLRSTIAVLELAAAAHEIPVASWPVQSARKSVCGRATFPTERNPRTGKKEGTAKREVMRYVRLLGHEPESDNEADAIVGWYYECSLLNPRVAMATTPLFGGRR
jgi:hypothetical protein